MSDRSVYVALGSNLPSRVGDRLATLAAALAAIDAAPDVCIGRVSDAWETEPVGPPQPFYLNAAAEIRTALPIAAVLKLALDVERSLGRDREREIRWGPRAIDIDLLLDGESTIDTPGLVVPHPRLAERAFVLRPLCEIAADVRDPRSGATVRSLLARLAMASPVDGESGGGGHLIRVGPIPFSAQIPAPDGRSPGTT